MNSSQIYPPLVYRLYAAPDAKRDEKGYVIEPKYELQSGWFASQMNSLQEAIIKNHELQREWGFQVYDGDPGKHPIEMNAHERYLIYQRTTNAWCTIF